MNTANLIKVVGSGGGDAFWALGEKLTFKLGAQDTGGRFAFNDSIALPQNGPPPHLHRREDEMFYVVDGEFAFSFRDRTFNLPKDSAVFLPRNVLHRYNNVGSGPGKLLVTCVPAGFEQFIRAWGQPVKDPSETAPPVTAEAVNNLLAAAPRFGLEISPEAKMPMDDPPELPKRDYWVLGQLVRVKLTSKETGGNFTVAEVISPPGASVLPHWHVAMEEVFYVLEGEMEFALGARVERVGAGATVFVPRGQLHGFKNVGSTPSRLFDLHGPGGFEGFFQEAGVPATDLSTPPRLEQPDPKQLIALARKYGMEVPEN